MIGRLLSNAEQRFDDIGTLCPNQTGNTQNFSLVQIKGDIANGRLVQRNQITHLQNYVAPLIFFTYKQETSNHHCNDLSHIQSFHRLSGNPLAVVRNSNFIAQLGSFFHFMRDIDNTATALFQLTDNGK